MDVHQRGETELRSRHHLPFDDLRATCAYGEEDVRSQREHIQDLQFVHQQQEGCGTSAELPPPLRGPQSKALPTCSIVIQR